MDRIPITDDIIRPQMLTLREFRPFKTSDEYLWAMKEDLSDWLNLLYPDLSITPHTFMECLETGVVLCKHANNVRRASIEWIASGGKRPKCWGQEWKLPTGEVIFNTNARAETFFARDNVHNFITWCRKLGIFECLLFESDDLILRKHEKNVILCLLEVARRGSHFGMATPLLVQFEKEIDRDIAKDTGQDLSSSGEEEESFQQYGPTPQIITNDLRSLDEMVRELVERCSCPTQFPMIRIAEGKYRIGNTKVMIYVRILRNHVMVRVGGGWDTLAHYLDKHDPCRCAAGHRAAVASKLIMKNEGSAPRMKVEYERKDLHFYPAAHSTPTYSAAKKPVDQSDSSSEISDEGYKTSDNLKLLMETPNGPGTIKDVPKGHQSRKNSVVRARSLSTDEDRPDSRSTDEENISINPAPAERPVVKSSSTSKVPRTYGHTRSISCERVKGPNVSYHSRHGSGEDIASATTSPDHSIKRPAWNAKQPLANGAQKSKAISVKQKVPTRSLSAGGNQEFFANTSRASANPRFAKTNTGVVNSHRNGARTPGKNTWNGTNATPVRVRPNLFKADFFSQQQANGSSSYDAVDGETNCYPDLAEWIKKALEHDSDADKISHIEQAIKQFEQKRQDASPELQSVSLPYSLSESPLSMAKSAALVRRRKENGHTKIPKPNFY